MTRIALPKRLTKAGQPLYDIANELSRGSDDGNVKSYIEAANLIFEGNFTNYLDQAVIMAIIGNEGSIVGNFMYLKIPVANFKTNLPQGISTRQRKEATGMKTMNFSEWIDSHIILMFSPDQLQMYLTSDPVAKIPLTGAELKVLVDSFGAQLLTIQEYQAISSTLI